MRRDCQKSPSQHFLIRSRRSARIAQKKMLLTCQILASYNALQVNTFRLRRPACPPLDRVPALPVEFVPLRGFFSFFSFVSPVGSVGSTGSGREGFALIGLALAVNVAYYMAVKINNR